METLIVVLLITVLSQTSFIAYKLIQSAQVSRGSIVVDTSALIDGRLLDIARSGFLSARLVVPRSVVRELQFMADRADHDKRERARFGLDVIEKLQAIPHLAAEVKEDGVTSQHGVDEQLINLAKQWNAKLCTVDYNLNKAARVQAVEVININELAHALRVIHLPGESVSIEIVQQGQDKQQGVGYLDDGTMVVVGDAKDFVGKSIEVTLTRVLQTSAGRMMFAELTSRAKQSKRQPKHDRPSPKKPQKRTAHTTTSTKKRTSKRRTPEDNLVDLANG